MIFYVYWPRFLLSLLFGISVFLFGYRQVIVPLRKEYIEIQKRIDLIGKEILVKNKSKRESGEGVDKGALQSNLDILDILELLEKITIASDVQVCLFEPQKYGDDSYTIKLGVKGDYKGLIDFVSGIFRFPCLVVFADFILEGKKDFIDMQLLLKVYKERSKASNFFLVSRRDVFKRENKKIGLHSWAIEKLRFMGLMKEDQRIFGIISDPLDYIHQVKVGDRLGFDQWKIIKIDSSGVFISDLENNVFHIKE